ncbi:uncharacterized protein DSM5745_07055 [Aspergillus mulundensis]|uniref:Uncharacterized protein n=1 Tax=Aspergillus mulundensis TaxID=1810919 RepID=A0A3D8RK24_9EURO|nr:hypothetical protein DSM5745_07055 [Aspergillus mulundensis]RDW74393.1 hypothetical protein DSM5745_07055 [Aspergillus mulundensis]
MKANAMTSLLILILTILQLSLVHAQISYDSKTNHLLCPAPNTHYCAAASLQGSSIVSCTPDGMAEIRSCSTEYVTPLLHYSELHRILSGILPVGYEEAAVCYQSSSHSGNAVCAFNGTGYTTEGLEVNVPETVLCDNITLIRPYAEKINGDAETYDAAATDYPYEPQPAVSIVRGSSEGHSPYSPISPSQHTATPLDLPSASTSTSRNPDAGEGIICSNPWARLGAKTADILTLVIVLVFPTPAPEIQSQLSTWFSSTSSMPTPITPCTEMRTLAPSRTTGLSSQRIPSSSSIEATLTLYGSPTTDPGVIESNKFNSGNILHMGILISPTVWALMACLVTLMC